MTAPFPVWRSYVAADELMSLALALLTDGETGTTLFDATGPGFEMGDIAQAVAAALGHRLGVSRAPLQPDREDRYVGDGVLYQDLCLRHRVEPVDFAHQVRETAKFMAQSAPAV